MQNETNIHDTKKIITGWVNQYTETLYSWTFQRIGQKEIAEDIVQETFVAAFERMDSFKNESSPKTWLMAILKNKIADHFRKSYRENNMNTPSKKDDSINFYFDELGEWKSGQSPQTWNAEDKNLLDDNDFQKALRKCLSLLPEKWRSLIQLKFLQQKPTEEICDSLGIATTNYWQMIHRAKLQLRKCIELRWFNN